MLRVEPRYRSGGVGVQSWPLCVTPRLLGRWVSPVHLEHTYHVKFQSNGSACVLIVYQVCECLCPTPGECKAALWLWVPALHNRQCDGPADRQTAGQTDSLCV